MNATDGQRQKPTPRCRTCFGAVRNEKMMRRYSLNGPSSHCADVAKSPTSTSSTVPAVKWKLDMALEEICRGAEILPSSPLAACLNGAPQAVPAHRPCRDLVGGDTLCHSHAAQLGLRCVADKSSSLPRTHWVPGSCGTTDDVWACLHCSHFACGRESYGHALRHFDQHQHPLVLLITTKRIVFWSVPSCLALR